ncbi:MAG: hypothetical protein M0C28_15645 [Candidatus Moduliflexus flocculans]|nr:hypothetical protein [Candidatus Moduliflexus flocculans]
MLCIRFYQDHCRTNDIYIFGGRPRRQHGLLLPARQAPPHGLVPEGVQPVRRPRASRSGRPYPTELTVAHPASVEPGRDRDQSR